MVWLRGTFGRGAGASSTGFRDPVDRLDDVYTTHATFGVPPPVHETLSREMLTYACCASLVRLCYTLKGYGVELTNPQACLAVLVADQRGQASLAIRVAVNVLCA